MKKETLYKFTPIAEVNLDELEDTEIYHAKQLDGTNCTFIKSWKKDLSPYSAILLPITELSEDKINEEHNIKNHLLNMVRYIKNNHQYCLPDGWKDGNGLGETFSDRDILDKFCASKLGLSIQKTDGVKCIDCPKILNEADGDIIEIGICSTCNTTSA